MNQRKKLTIGLVALVVLSLSLFFMGDKSQAIWQKNQDEKVWDQYADTKKDFEKNVHDLVTTKYPADRSLSEEHLRLEMAKLDQKSKQFEYLRAKHPERIERSKGVEKFVAFDWSDKDEAALAGSDSRYASKSKDVEQMQLRFEGRKGKGDFEKHLGEVKDSLEYRSLRDRFNDMVAKIETSVNHVKHDLKKK